MRRIKVILTVSSLLFIGIVVYESRKAVQKKQVDNTLKQLGMALQNYHSTHSEPTSKRESDKDEEAIRQLQR